MKRQAFIRQALIWCFLIGTLTLAACGGGVSSKENTQPTASIEPLLKSVKYTPGDTVSLSCTASDKEDGALTGDSLKWKSDRDGVLGTGNRISVNTLSKGAHTISLTATDSGGLTATDFVTVVVDSGNKNAQPTASIGTLTGGGKYAPGDTINFSGSASDTEDGPLTGASLKWSSSRDGDLGAGENISASTLSEGAHTVSLTATDSGGATHTDFVTVLVAAPATPVNNPPQVTISSPGSGSTFTVGQSVSFSGGAADTEDGQVNENNLKWSSSKDGSIGTGKDISHTLTSGTHLITLTATDSKGLENIKTIAVTVGTNNSANTAPLADAGSPQSIIKGDVVTLDGSNSSDSDGDALTYIWTLESIPAGSNAVLSNETSANPGFTADIAGKYVAKLIVNDGKVNSAPATVEISTLNFAPVAYAGVDQTVMIGGVVSLDGSASTDVEGSTLTYQWTLDSRPIGSTASLTDVTSATPTFTPDVAGAYKISLVVNDGTAGSIADSVTLQAGNVKPVANIIVIRPSNLNIGSTVAFDGGASSDANNDTLIYQWTLISRPTGSTASLSDTTASAPTITVDLLGTYTAKLVVSDSKRPSDPVTASFTVTEPPVVLDSIGFEESTTAGFTGGWELTTTRPHSGTKSLQPPNMATSGTTAAEIAYNKPHTQISFWVYNDYGPAVNLYIDDNCYDTYPSHQWNHQVINVPEGTHTYRWEVTTTVAGRPNVWLDDVQFYNAPPVANSTGPYGFEEGFLIQEFTGGWDIDNRGAHTGSYALRAPYMATSGTTAAEIAYNKPHTQISFWVYNDYGPAVNLYIDDNYYDTYPSRQWNHQVINVPEGTHTYRWEATTTVAGRPNVWLDDVQFYNAPPVANSTGPYGFEEGFLSQEFTGGWDIDNRGAHTGSYALRAPYMATSGTTAAGITYNKPHTQISFWLYNDYGPAVNLYIDDNYYDTYPSRQWNHQVINVPEGTHTYRWEATTTAAGRPHVWLDDIRFYNAAPVANPTGPYGFEEGFLSQEFTGGWDIDNWLAHSGAYALRGPFMATSGTTAAGIAYNKPHTQISFWLYNYYGPAVNLYIDDNYYDTYPSDRWNHQVINVPEGTHTYRWEVTTTIAGRPKVYLDDIQLYDVAPVTNPTGPYGFEEGFLTQEFTGGWDIDNMGAHTGSYALRAPYMATSGTTAAEIAYNKSHTQISFWVYNYYGPAVNLYIDDNYYDTYPSAGWNHQVIDVPEGTHTYRWEATTTVAGRPKVYLDDIRFYNVAPVANPTGPYGFEEGFLTPEFTGGWDIDNWLAHTGSYALRAPNLSTAGTTTAELASGKTHTQISFWIYNYYGPAVDFYIDGVLSATYPSVGWTNQVVTVPSGTHTYRWSVTTTGVGRPNVYLDDIVLQ